MITDLKLAGEFELTARDKDGRMLWLDKAMNGIVTDGLTDALRAVFATGTQRSWYFGLIGATGFTALAAADTMASHSGWTELTGYSSSTRPAFSPTISEALAFNPTPISFTATTSLRIKGIFIASDSTKGGSSGILWSTAQLTIIRDLIVGQSLELTYRLRASGGA